MVWEGPDRGMGREKLDRVIRSATSRRENLSCDRLDWESQPAHSFFPDAYSSQAQFADTFKLIFEMGYFTLKPSGFFWSFGSIACVFLRSNCCL